GMLQAKGRRLIGWDEIAEGGLSPTATVMSWRGVSGGTAAAKVGRYAVMSPEKPLYLDHGQGFSGLEPPHWPGRETLEEVHAYEPVPPGLSAAEGARILGLQGNLWTIFANNDTLLQIQAFPRLCAVAEVGWSAVKRPGFADFAARLALHRARLSALGIGAWEEPPSRKVADWAPDPALAKGTVWRYPLAKGSLVAGDLQIWFRYAGGTDALSIRGVRLMAGGKVVAQDIHAGVAGSDHRGNLYRMTVPASAVQRELWLESEVFVEPWSGGGKGDSKGTVTIVQGRSKPVRTFAPEVPPARQETTTPVPHNRDKAIYDWPTRHAQTKRLGPALKPDTVVIGDSIMHYWGGAPVAP
ncbi:MAG: family 20 glycosylhydrolase, partial [Armatimonadaceae bacterium]